MVQSQRYTLRVWFVQCRLDATTYGPRTSPAFITVARLAPYSSKRQPVSRVAVREKLEAPRAIFFILHNG